MKNWVRAGEGERGFAEICVQSSVIVAQAKYALPNLQTH